MFKSLVPWKRRNGHVAVRHDEPARLHGDEVHPLVRLQHDFDVLMDRMFEDQGLGDRWTNRFPSLWSDAAFDWDANVGWEDGDSEYVLRAELPGFEPEDFELKISGNVLTLRAEHKDESTRKNGGSSYRYGAFSRSVTLPQAVDQDKIDARYHSGVLEVHLPKTEAARGRRIEVKSAKGSSS